MNTTRKTAGETARERVIVAVCDVFEIKKTVESYRARGYEPTGEWCYANGAETMARVWFRPRSVWSFDVHDLLDDLVWLFISGRYSRKEAEQVLNVLQAQEGGAK